MDTAPKAISYADVIHSLRAAEEKYDLLKYQIDGISAWALLRFFIGLRLSRVAPSRSQGLQRHQKLPWYARDVWNLLRTRPAQFIIKTYSTARGERTEDGRFKDHYFDDLLPRLASFCKMESINHPSFVDRNRQAWIPSHLSVLLFERMALALQKRCRGPQALQSIAGGLLGDLQKAWPEEAFTLADIEHPLSYFYWFKRVFSWWLRRIQPAWVLTADPGEYALIAAARELGIRTVELQHGFVDGNRHLAYSWSSYALRYKENLPIADRFFIYGDHWREKLMAGGFWNESLRVVGSLRVDQYRALADQHQWKAGRCHLVVTSSGLDAAALADFIAQALKWVGPEGCQVSIKLHPVWDHDPSLYEKALAAHPGVKVIRGNESPTTFALLAEADLHAAIDSTCHYEALALGVPTIVLPFTNSENVSSLVDAGHAVRVETPDALSRRIRACRGERVNPSIRDYYFKRGAADNMLRELQP